MVVKKTAKSAEQYGRNTNFVVNFTIQFDILDNGIV